MVAAPEPDDCELAVRDPTALIPAHVEPLESIAAGEVKRGIGLRFDLLLLGVENAPNLDVELLDPFLRVRARGLDRSRRASLG
jgi:hypothetical protein